MGIIAIITPHKTGPTGNPAIGQGNGLDLEE